MKELSIGFILVSIFIVKRLCGASTEEAVFVLFGGILWEVGGFLVSSVIVVLLR